MLYSPYARDLHTGQNGSSSRCQISVLVITASSSTKLDIKQQLDVPGAAVQELRLQEDLYISFFYLFFILFTSLIGIVIYLIREQARSLVFFY